MLADAAREDERVDPAHGRGERADRLPRLVAEHFDGERRIGVGPAAREERLHVCGHPGDAEQSRLVAHDALERLRILTGGEQVEEDARIEVAGARAHHDAARRREPHRRVVRRAVHHRGHARAVAEVRDDGAPQRLRAHGADHVFVRETVEAVATDPPRGEAARHREAARHLRERVVEIGVEADHLAHAREARRHRVDPAELGGEMQRSEGDHVAQRGEERRVHERRRVMVGASVDQAVAYRLGRGEARLGEGGERAVDGGVVISRVLQPVDGHAVRASAQPEAAAALADALHRPLGDPSLLRRALVHARCTVEERELQRRRPTVQREDGDCLHCHFQSRTSGMSSMCTRTYSLWRASAA